MSIPIGSHAQAPFAFQVSLIAVMSSTCQISALSQQSPLWYLNVSSPFTFFPLIDVSLCLQTPTPSSIEAVSKQIISLRSSLTRCNLDFGFNRLHFCHDKQVVQKPWRYQLLFSVSRCKLKVSSKRACSPQGPQSNGKCKFLFTHTDISRPMWHRDKVNKLQSGKL